MNKRNGRLSEFFEIVAFILVLVGIFLWTDSAGKESEKKQDAIWEENWNEAFEEGYNDAKQQGLVDGYFACLENRGLEYDPGVQDPDEGFLYSIEQDTYDEDYMQTGYDEGYYGEYDNALAYGYQLCLINRELEYDKELDDSHLFDRCKKVAGEATYEPKEYDQTNDTVPFDREYDYSSLEFTKVDSSCFSEIAYDEKNEIMVYRFKDSGALYYYYKITAMLYYDFLDSSSLGSYYERNIKGWYTCYRLE